MDPASGAGNGPAQTLYAIGALVAAVVSGVTLLFRRRHDADDPLELVDPDDRPGRIRERIAKLEAAVRSLRRDVDRFHPRERDGGGHDDT